MADQIRHIINLTELAHIDIRIIPFSHGSHTGLEGGYATMEFTKARSIVLLEHKRSSGFLDEPKDVAPFHEATSTLVNTALTPLESVNFLAAKTAYYDRS
nr:Putative DNA-binding protein [Kibdelosporangium sp. MJ126-NF4]